MSDDALIALAQHRFELADSEEATHDDCRQLRDIFPAVLQRLREKVEITRDLVFIEEIDLGNPAHVKRMLERGESATAEDDQLQLSLSNF